MKLPRRSLNAVLRRIETMSVHGAERHWGLLPRDQAGRLGARIERVGDGLLTLLRASDALRMNRVIGLGHRGLATEAMVDRIIATYRAARRRRFSILMSPGPQARTITRWLLARGFERHGGHALLLRDGRRPVPAPVTDVRVTRARRDQAGVVVAIHDQTFGVPASRRRWALAAAAARGTAHHLAFVGRATVGAGATRIEGDLAWLGGGATLTRWRRRGAHAALIAARLRYARRRGCRWVWVETALPAPGRPGGSRRNLIRLGFEPVVVKPTFVWQDRTS